MKHAPSRFAPMIFCSMARNMKSSSILMTRNFQPVAKSAHPAKQFEVDKPYLFHYFHPVVPPLDFIRPFPCLGIAQASLVSALGCMKTFIFDQHPYSKELELHIVLFSRLRGRSGSVKCNFTNNILFTCLTNGWKYRRPQNPFRKGVGMGSPFITGQRYKIKSNVGRTIYIWRRSTTVQG